MEDPSPSAEGRLSKLADEEVHRRVKELIALGNSPKVTELILLQAGALPEQVQEAQQKVQRQKQVEIKEQGFLGWVIVLAGLLVLLLGAYLWLNRPAATTQATPPPSTSNPTSLIDSVLQTFFDTQNIPPVDDLPEPFVEYLETGQEAACPANPADAAALFGGNSGKWTFQNETRGWLFYNDTPSQLSLPKDMAGSLAYGSARSPKFLPVLGPVQISQVHMAFILCP